MPRSLVKKGALVSPEYDQGIACVCGSYSSTREPLGEPRLSKISNRPLSRNWASCWASQGPRAAHSTDPFSVSNTAMASTFRIEISTCPALNPENRGANSWLNTLTEFACRGSDLLRPSSITRGNGAPGGTLCFPGFSSEDKRAEYGDSRNASRIEIGGFNSSPSGESITR